MSDRKIFAGDRLRRARERLGLNQAEAAQLIAISASYYNQLENDQRPITQPILARLAARFKISDTYFVDTDDVRRASHLREALADPGFPRPPGLARLNPVPGSASRRNSATPS